MYVMETLLTGLRNRMEKKYKIPWRQLKIASEKACCLKAWEEQALGYY